MNFITNPFILLCELLFTLTSEQVGPAVVFLALVRTVLQSLLIIINHLFEVNVLYQNTD